MPAATTSIRDVKTRSDTTPASKNGKSTKQGGHRYGRIKREGDEEIVREARSDDGTSQSDFSDGEDSASRSSVNSISESRQQSSTRSDRRPDLSNGRTSTTSDPSEPGPSSGTSFLDALRAARLDWSDIVDESERDIQVIQFDKLGELNIDDVEVDPEDDKSGSKSTQKSRHQSFKRPVGMSARQVYLKRLESDPAYIPRVGEFWGHDERLLDKDLRSLSGWWRGKWTGRGGFASRGGSRGRFGTHGRTPTQNASDGETNTLIQHRSDPVEQTWKHDGFEEMSKDEESQNRGKHSEGHERSGSWTVNRGRGRGGIVNSIQNRSTRSQSFASPTEKPYPHRLFGHARAQSMSWNRYEYAWTKHSVTFLFQDTPNKSKANDEVAVRVKLPGQSRYNVVRVPKSHGGDKKAVDDDIGKLPTRTIVVRLPKSTTTTADPESTRTVASPPILEVTPSASLKAETQDVSPAEGIISHVATLSTPIIETDSVTNPPGTTVTEIRPLEQATPDFDNQERGLQDRPLPNVQLVTNIAKASPSPAYSSPSYGPGYHYPLPRPAHGFSANGMTMGDTPVWFDPRMPYGYPTPPPLPGHMYTPPPSAPVHHVHHHSHSLSHPHNYPHIPPMTPSYYAPTSVTLSDYQHVQAVPTMVPPTQPSDQQPPTFTYSADGAMIDPQTGAPIFSPAKPATKVAIRKPDGTSGDTLSPNAIPVPASNPGTSEPQFSPGEDVPKEIRHQVQTHYALSPSDLSASVNAGFSPNQIPTQPHPVFWNTFPPQGGYYYHPHGYSMPGHAPDYSLGHQFQQPMHAYPHQPHGDVEFQQPPMYY